MNRFLFSLLLVATICWAQSSEAPKTWCPELYYPVVPGDSCWAIATRNNLTYEQLLKLNPYANCNPLQIGALLCVVERVPLPPCQIWYEVEKDQSCYEFWSYHHLFEDLLHSINPALNCDNKLTAGTKICISVR